MPKTPVRVLVVEDSAEDFKILQILFSKVSFYQYALEQASSLSAGLEKLKKNQHDVYLVDYQLGPDSGIEFLKEAAALKCQAPVILLTGQGDHEVDMEAMALGAADFLNKGKLDSAQLERAIRYALERKKTQIALRNSEEFLRAVVENAMDGIAVVRKGGEIHYVSSAVERIMGHQAQDVVGKGLVDFVHPDDAPRLQQMFEYLFRAPGNIQTIEAQARHKNGSWRLIEATAQSHLFPDQGQLMAVFNYRDVTERKKAERINSRLATIVEFSQDAIFSTTLDGIILSWNSGAQQIYGFKPEEASGRHISVILSPNGEKEYYGLLERVRDGKAVSNLVEAHRTKGGKEVLVSLTLSPISNHQGQVTSVSIVARDITEAERAKISREVLQSERDELLNRLQLQMENMPIACVLSDQNFNFTYWNPAAEKMFGYVFMEVEGKGAKETIVPDPPDWPKVDLSHERTQKSSHPIQGDIWEHRRKDGKKIICEWYSTPLKDADGNLLGAMGMAIDVTERRKAEDVQSQLAAILQQTSDAVVGTDLEGNIFSWNRGAEALFGYRLDGVLGQSITLLSPEDRKHETEELREVVKGGESISNFETVRMNKDGGLIEVSITMSPVKDSKGKIIGVSAIHRDITEKKQAEESLRKHEEQLRRVEKMNAIGRLAGGVAHDFNNLLSVIGGNAEFLMGSLDKESPHREEVEEIQKAVRRGAELAKQLLVFGQKQVSQPQPVNLNELSAEMSKMLKRLIDATVDLAIIQDKQLKPVLADAGQMQQIILNLVLNARDAMPNGGHLILETRYLEAVDLEKEGRPTLPLGSYARLSVTDTGTGMSPEIQKHIFEPFFTTKAGKGTGLGLATVYGLVSKWSGHIFVHSTPGMGTTFTLYFPAMASVEGFEVKPKQISLIPQGSETILLAEDEEPVRKVLVRTLEKYGYRVIEAVNGLEAVQKAWDYTKPIDLLLTDTIMPKMNGKELADELKKSRPKTKVVFVSGYPKEVLSQQGILNAGIHLIQKPFELEDLVRQVRKILDEK